MKIAKQFLAPIGIAALVTGQVAPSIAQQANQTNNRNRTTSGRIISNTTNSYRNNPVNQNLQACTIVSSPGQSPKTFLGCDTTNSTRRTRTINPLIRK